MSKSKREKRNKTKKLVFFDYSLLAVLLFLICFGLVMLYSSSAYSALVKFGDSMYYFKRQLFFFGVGLIIMYIASRIDYHFYLKWSKVIYWTAMVAMLLVKTPLGKEVNGARRWIRLPAGQQLQPAEIAKIAVILFIPALICQMGKEIKTLHGILVVLMWGGGAAAGVLFLTENLSTAVIVVGITCVMIFVIHPMTKPFLALAGSGLAAFLILVQVLNSFLSTSDNFRIRRLLVWLNPEKYASDGGYQTLQGLYAVGSGGFFGKGLGNSAQKMVIPEVQNDMILSVICEELGVFGAIIVLVLFGMLLLRLVFIAQNAPDVYCSLVVTGIFTHIALQVLLNFMVVLNVIPNTGITLPFISYGGTATLFLMMEMGIALGISARIKFEE